MKKSLSPEKYAEIKTFKLNIAETIIKVFRRGSVNHIEWPEERLRMEIEHVKFSSSRLQNITGWKPEYDFASGLEMTKAAMKNMNSRG